MWNVCRVELRQTLAPDGLGLRRDTKDARWLQAPVRINQQRVGEVGGLEIEQRGGETRQ
jgi:hypothetical protein